MASIEENKNAWDKTYEWNDDGAEWSAAWGGADMQWKATIFPRISRFLPVSTILEIAPGHGRWTEFLKDYCENLLIVDLSDSCIEACRRRFSNETKISYFVNNGKSLEFIEDGKVDFIFSFDSLVHAEDDVIESYISEISRKLSSNGVAFLHHSNCAEYKLQSRISNIPKVGNLLKILGFLEKSYHWRATSMNANKIIEYSDKYNLKCISQELIPWGTKTSLIDCISVIVKPASKWNQIFEQYRNNHFMIEAENIKMLSKLYLNR